MSASVRWMTAQVEQTNDIVPGVREIVLRYPGRVSAPVGSHIDVITLVHGKEVVRSYSVVDCDPLAQTLRIAVRLAVDGGGGSRYMHGLRCDDRLRTTEARQDFPLDHGRPGYVLVAGGIGITALAGMFLALAGRGVPVRLTYVGRDRSQMPLLTELSAAHPELVETVITSERQRLDAREFIAAVPPGHHLYVCGPLGLLEDLRREWAAAGRPPAALRFETFGGSGAFPQEEFVVEVPSQGLRTVVPAGTSILDALNDAGAAMMADCRRGECGLCEVKVVACDGLLDHRDVFLSARQRASGRSICTCVTRAVAPPDGPRPAVLVLELP